ncbi:hypothetical protein [Marinoscillum sp.]|uniref:hypothetical protein n=1 Tax=Marinoscillum sp. TaxID=2024838 RepID=UPI003BAD5CA4
MKGKLIYSEKQTFRNTFFWWLQAMISLGVIGMFAYGVSKQLIRGEQWGNTPMSDTALIITALISFIILGAVQWLLSSMTLLIEIDQNNLYYSYFPFVRSKRTLTKKDLTSLEVRKYKPILEYGGWGYRISFNNGKALNIKGNWGLQLVLQNGDKLLLGTQKAEALKEAINTLQQNWNER